MTDVYQELALFLDRLPAGFPATEDGLELRILKRLFTPEEARVAMLLSMLPESAAAVAARTGENEADLESIFSQMSKKGLIFRISKNDQNVYSAAQFVVGIWEYHLNSLDEGLIRDVNAYLPAVMKKSWMETQTKQMRIVPVSKSLSAGMTVMPHEAAEAIINAQSKIVISPCICRKEQKLIGKGCDRTMEACFSFGAAAYYYEQNGLGRSIEKAEALDILKAGVASGLVLQPGNQQRPANICMCCGCCCAILKNLKSLDKPALAIHTNYFAQVTASDCVGCGVCADRCQMDAIGVDEIAQIDENRCIGCGLCVTDCPTAAMVLSEKTPDDRYVPPNTVFDTYMAMAKERGLF